MSYACRNLAVQFIGLIPAKKLKRVKYLMLSSQLLLLAFMGYWLYSQYKSTSTDFRKAITAQFEESQRKVSDSLLLGDLTKEGLLPHPSQIATIDVHSKSSIELSPEAKTSHNFDIIRTQNINRPWEPKPGEAFVLENNGPDTNSHLPFRKDVNFSVIIRRANAIADSDETRLFHRDTLMFNSEFEKKMKENGWGFKIKWLRDSMSGPRGKKNIYIKSQYFTNSYGVEISHFSWYLIKKISPQILFTLALLVVTGFASRLAYKSLKEQVALGTIKNDFISNMSHELKTPVSTIKVALEALDTYNVIEDKKTAKEYLEMANIEVKRLDLLINQALNTSLLEDGRIAFHKEKEDLQKLVSEVLDVLKLRFAQQHAQVNYNKSGNRFYSQVDKLHIQGVLINILDNSLKYGGKDPIIDVNITEDEKETTITIADKGPGIPAAYLDKVFEKFFRVPTGNEHNVKGYGLGLSYAKQVMQQHGGSIKAANKPEGGSIFTLTFIKDAA